MDGFRLLVNLLLRILRRSLDIFDCKLIDSTGYHFVSSPLEGYPVTRLSKGSLGLVYVFVFRDGGSLCNDLYVVHQSFHNRNKYSVSPPFFLKY